MSGRTHYSLNGWDSPCSDKRTFHNITKNPDSVTCDICSKAVYRMSRAKEYPRGLRRVNGESSASIERIQTQIKETQE